ARPSPALIPRLGVRRPSRVGRLDPADVLRADPAFEAVGEADAKPVLVLVDDAYAQARVGVEAGAVVRVGAFLDRDLVGQQHAEWNSIQVHAPGQQHAGQ